jgi:hypothetical protein
MPHKVVKIIKELIESCSKSIITSVARCPRENTISPCGIIECSIQQISECYKCMFFLDYGPTIECYFKVFTGQIGSLVHKTAWEV